MRPLRIAICCALALGASSPSANALLGKKIYFGMVGGVDLLSSDSTSAGTGATRPVIGSTAGFLLGQNIGLGAQAASASSSSTVLGAQVTQLSLLGELNYFFSMFHLGGKLGYTLFTESLTGSSSTNTNIYTTYGPTFGVDVPVGTMVTIGGEASLLKYNDSGSAMQALAVLKLNF